MTKTGLFANLRAAFKGPGAKERKLGAFLPVFSEPVLSAAERDCVQDFSRLYYDKLDEGRGLHTIVLSWMGYEMFKCPLDLWIYQELIFVHRFDLIIEIGTYKGGSALYLANVLDNIGEGHVVSVDIDDGHREIRPVHERIEYIHGSSTDPAIFDRLSKLAEGKRNPLVILDGDHRCEHVLKELRLYQNLIAPGGYLIVEDTNVNGHPAFETHGPGPWEAVDAFLEENSDFHADRTCERFLLTMNPRGFLRRKPA